MSLTEALRIKKHFDGYRFGSIRGANLAKYRQAVQVIRQAAKRNPTKPTLSQAVAARMAEIEQVHAYGGTEMSGKLRRTYTDPHGWDQGEVIGRFGGMKSSYPELERISDSPKAIAQAIRRGSGKVYNRVVSVVRDEMIREGFAPSRKRSVGRPVIPPHEGRAYYSACKVSHSKNQHRFHGKGAFHRTHLFSFPASKNPKQATQIYGRVLLIQAQKTEPHAEVCDAECKACHHCYVHEFKPGAVMYGLPNGDLLIRSSRK